MKKSYRFRIEGAAGIASFHSGDELVLIVDSGRPVPLVVDSPEHHYFYVKEGIGLEAGSYADPASGGFRDGVTTLLSFHYGVTIVDAAITGVGRRIDHWQQGETFEVTGLGPDYGRQGTGNVLLQEVREVSD